MLKDVQMEEFRQLPGKGKYKWTIDVKEFLASGKIITEVVIPTGKTVDSVSASIRSLVCRCKLPIAVTKRNDRLFLIRKDAL